MKPSRHAHYEKGSLVLLKKKHPFKKRKEHFIESQRLKKSLRQCQKNVHKHGTRPKISDGAWWNKASTSTSNSNLNACQNPMARNYSKSPYKKRSSVSNAVRDASDSDEPEVLSSSDEVHDEYDVGDNSFLLDDKSHRQQKEEETELPSFIVHGYNNVFTSGSDSDDGNSSQRHQMDTSELPQFSGRKSKTRQEAQYSDDDDDDEEEIETEESMKFFSDHKSGTIVALLHHPTSFTFYGKAQVRVISGSVHIFGYDLDSRTEDFMYLYSFQELSTLKIRTNSAEWKTASHWTDVQNKLEQCVPTKLASLVLDSSADSTVILLLRKHDLAYAVDFACSYIPCPIPCHNQDLKMMRYKGFTIIPDVSNAIHMSKAHETVSENIARAIRLSVIKQQDAPRILVFGKRGFGKSTTLRYFVNKTLCSRSKVYYLDTDPGQSEFTPPGCVSLVEVTQPLLGPPFTHPKIPVKTAFYGNISIENINAFLSCVDKIVEFYKSNFSDYPLFVNTFGWIQGLGKDCLNHIREVVSPNIEVELVSNETIGQIDYESELEKEARKQGGTERYEIPGEVRQIPKQFNAPTKRALSILAYFGRLQPYFAPLMSLNSLKPLCMRVEDVAIHVIQSVFQKCILQAINASFVALCVVDESQILCCVDDENQPKRLAPHADFSDCVGFGFVRAIDIKKNVLYILTPEPYDVLKRVNTIVKGNILMPQVVFEKQEICGKPLPYLKQIYGKKNVLSQKLKRGGWNK